MLYGIGWFITLLPTAIIAGQVAASLHYADPVHQMLYIQKLFIILGATAFVQVLWGHRLPLIIGPSSILLIGIVTTLSSGTVAIYSSILTGGVLLMLAAATGVLKKIHHYFTPRIIAVILMLIALTLAPVILRLVIGNTTQPFLNLILFILLTFLLAIGDRLLRGIMKSTLLLWGLLIGWAMFALMPATPSSVSAIARPEEISFLILPAFKLEPGALLAFLFCYLAFSVNQLSSIEAIGHLLKVEDTTQRNKRGVFVAGLSNVCSGLFGVIGTVDFSMSAGIIPSMRCSSRFTMVPSALLLIACALIPGVIPSFLAIPKPVLGSMMLYIMTLQLGSGLNMVAAGRLVDSPRSGIIVAMPMMLALIIAFTPETVFMENFQMLRPIIGNAFIMGCLSVFFLEHVVFRTPRENGAP